MSKLSLIVISIIATLGYIQAQNCIDHSTVQNGACTCDAAYYGIANVVGGTCSLCPSNTVVTVRQLSTRRFLQLAPDGITGTLFDCNTCTPGSYMETAAAFPAPSPLMPAPVPDVPAPQPAPVVSSPAAAVCTPCPDNTTNTIGSFNTGTISSQCPVCAKNYYMISAQISADKPYSNCAICQNGTGTPDAISVGLQGAQDISKCSQCLDGYFMTANAVTGSSPQAAKCTNCPSYSTITGSNTIKTITACKCYDQHANPLSDSASECTCKNGYAGKPSTHSDGSNGCTACSEGQFSTGGSACTTCARGSTISQDFSSCTCNDSSSGVTSWSASTNKCQCIADYYGDPSTAISGTTGSCQRCPTGKTSPAGTTSINGCIDPSQLGSSSGNTNQNGQSQNSSTQNQSAAYASSLAIYMIMLAITGLFN